MTIVSMDELDTLLKCGGCKVVVTEPYIECVACRPDNVYLCLQCFSKGAEFRSHESDHSYTIIRNDFPLFENNWTAAEDLVLLEALADCGYGNWSDAAQRLRTKSKRECERHYNKSFINCPVPELPQFEEKVMEVYPQPVVYKLSDDPPRFPDSSVLTQEMGGYMAARGDFNVEYDNFQELEIQSISFDDDDDDEHQDDLIVKLKLSVLDIYLDSLKKRGKRKMIVRKYGLINLPKVHACNRVYDFTIKDIVDKTRVFMRMLSPFNYDKFIKGLHMEKELKMQIRKLQEFRENGITCSRNISIYKELKRRRQDTKRQRNLFKDIAVRINDDKACNSWLQKQAVLETIAKGVSNPVVPLPRRSAPPLDIVGMPGYDKLNKAEQEMCTSNRLVPEAYLEFRAVMMTECKKLGCLKLSHARNMIKIDVNKTRKLYDFLLSEGLINKDPL